MTNYFRSISGGSAAFAMMVAQIVPVSLPLGMSAAAAQQYGTRSRTIQCSANGNSQRTCRLPDNTQSVTFVGPDRSMRCREGQTWYWQGRQLTVTNGCGGNFEALYYTGNNNGGNWGGNNGGNWGGNNGGNWNNNNNGFASEIQCGSWNNNSQRCNARTENRVQIVQVNSGQCVQGRDWTYTSSRIEVRNGCSARFAYGYGSYQPNWNNGGNWNNNPGYQPPRDNGSNAGAVIGGVALAAGLVALLAAAGKKSGNTSGTGVAKISADLAKFPSDARTEAQACMNEAARQIGSTGGTQVTLTRVDRAERTSSGWTLVAQVTGTYDGKGQNMTMDCRVNGSNVSAFEVR